MINFRLNSTDCMGLQSPHSPNRNGSYEDHVMAKRQLPSPEVLRQLLSYDPDTGKLFWKERSVEHFEASRSRSAQHICSLWNARYAGREALTAVSGSARNCLGGRLLGRMMTAHKAAWAVHYGEWHAGEIDHVNGDAMDNRLKNLRLCTRAENCANRGSRKGSTSQYLGVDKLPNGKWRAQIKPAGLKASYLGSFEDERTAAAAYDDAARAHHGEFARLNFG